MPTTPIIIPLVVAGVTLGSLLVSQTRKISKKKLLTASLGSGLLNTAYAYVVYTLAPPTTFTRGSFSGGTFAGGTFTGAFTGGGGFRAAAGATSEPSFLLSSFVTGFLIVIAIVVVALAYVRFKGSKSEEEEASEMDQTDQVDETEETKLEET